LNIGEKTAIDNIDVVNSELAKQYCTANDLNNISYNLNKIIYELNKISSISGIVFKVDNLDNSLFTFTDDETLQYKSYLNNFNISKVFSFKSSNNKTYLDLNIDNLTIKSTPLNDNDLALKVNIDHNTLRLATSDNSKNTYITVNCESLIENDNPLVVSTDNKKLKIKYDTSKGLQFDQTSGLYVGITSKQGLKFDSNGELYVGINSERGLIYDDNGNLGLNDDFLDKLKSSPKYIEPTEGDVIAYVKQNPKRYWRYWYT
jgi:hypothetical protein